MNGAGAPGAPLDFVDFTFDVPQGLPGTDLTKPEAVYWQVQVIVPLFGPDLETVFLAPIYAQR